MARLFLVDKSKSDGTQTTTLYILGEHNKPWANGLWNTIAGPFLSGNTKNLRLKWNKLTKSGQEEHCPIQRSMWVFFSGVVDSEKILRQQQKSAHTEQKKECLDWK